MKTKKVKSIKTKKQADGEAKLNKALEEIKQEQREIIKLQEAYEEAFLVRMHKQAMITEIRDLLIFYKKKKLKIVEWNNNKYSFERLAAEYTLEAFYYRRAVSNERFSEQALMNKGFTEKELMEVRNGHYKKGNEEKPKTDYIG